MIPAFWTRESVRVDFPWSTWAMTDMFRTLLTLSISSRICSTVKLTGLVFMFECVWCRWGGVCAKGHVLVTNHNHDNVVEPTIQLTYNGNRFSSPHSLLNRLSSCCSLLCCRLVYKCLCRVGTVSIHLVFDTFSPAPCVRHKTRSMINRAIAGRRRDHSLVIAALFFPLPLVLTHFEVLLVPLKDEEKKRREKKETVRCKILT